MTHDPIKLANENGWNPSPQTVWAGSNTNIPVHVLDPLFWQALGKALGWKPVTIYPVRDLAFNEEAWKHNALEYLRLLLVVGQEKADEYLTSLLKS